MEPRLSTRLLTLQRILSESPRLIVAFSGGVDSTTLLKVATDHLGADRVLAVTSRSESLAAREVKECVRLAAVIGVPLRFVNTRELDLPQYRKNDANRCYFCKYTLFATLLRTARELGYDRVVFGAIRDDYADIRPGLLAARELAVGAPLAEAGFSKAEVRALARHYQLPNAEKPASACLASRIPTGTPVSAAVLSQVERAEEDLWQRGFGRVRVRHHGEIARIEVDPEEFPRIVADAAGISARLREVGYRFVTLDLVGYQTGGRAGSGSPRQEALDGHPVP
ncbi:MAG: ATP-dependent sacrificial sulfur transferase LarE [Thermaerobacter sp.]|nr:ATP-dependent sacrificial sulfur transferase LarE [Thermaerobacter sp.]